MVQKSNDKISIANILALAGLAAIGVITFFGSLLHSTDGKPGGAIIWAITVMAVLGFLLFMSIKAKGAEDNFEKWRYVEWGCLIAYIVAAVLFSTPFQRFIYIVSEKESMQKQARAEVDSINALYQSYDHQQRKYLDEAVEQIRNYWASGQYMDKEKDSLVANYVKEFVKLDVNVKRDKIETVIKSWEDKASGAVVVKADKNLSEIKNRIENWNFIELFSLAADLEKETSTAWTSLEAKIRTNREKYHLIPVITGGGSTSYQLSGYAKFDLGTPPEARFGEMLCEADGSTLMGWVIYIILNALILLNYLVTSGSRYVSPGAGKSNTEGLDL